MEYQRGAKGVELEIHKLGAVPSQPDTAAFTESDVLL